MLSPHYYIIELLSKASHITSYPIEATSTWDVTIIPLVTKLTGASTRQNMVLLEAPGCASLDGTSAMNFTVIAAH